MRRFWIVSCIVLLAVTPVLAQSSQAPLPAGAPSGISTAQMNNRDLFNVLAIGGSILAYGIAIWYVTKKSGTGSVTTTGTTS